MRSIYKGYASTLFGLILTGLAAGFTNGLLGAGGGTVVVFGIARVLKGRLKNGNDVFSTALCVMLPISALSCLLYLTRGHITTSGFGVFALPALLGGAVGGALLGKIRSEYVKKLFASLVVISGILLIMR